MKKSILLSVMLAFTGIILAQSPQNFNYQAVARNSSGDVLIEQNLTVRIGILQNEELIWQEDHPVTTNTYGLFTLKIGSEDAQNASGTAGTFADIDWSTGTYTLTTEIDSGNGFVSSGGSKLASVPFAMYADKAGSVIKIDSIINNVSGWKLNADTIETMQPVAIGTKETQVEEPLFEVRNDMGNPVFAVYNDGVIVYVDEDKKGLKGGFAVGGYNSASKGITQEYMRITPDSVRFWVPEDNTNPKAPTTKGGFAVGGYNSATKQITNDLMFINSDSIRMFINTDPEKGVKGGFAVGGYTSKKGINNDFLRVTPDSTRIYINADQQAKGVKGGFAVGGYTSGKGLNDDYLFVSGKDAVDIVNNKAQILWYPRKEAFLAGNIYIPHPDSVGQNSTALGFQSQARGNWSQAFGYKSYALGDYSTAIGRNAVSGFSSFAFGNRAKAMGDISYALGSGSEATGQQSFALGVNSSSTNDYSTSLGYEATASGQYATAIGYQALASGNSAFSAGRLSEATAQNSLSLGNGSVSSGLDATSIGYRSQAQGEKSIAIGSYYSYTFTSLPFFNISGLKNDTKADFEFILWDPIISPIFTTISFNRANIAEGKYSISIGNGNYSNNGGMALGSNNDATAFGAVSLGISNKAQNTNSFAAGYSSTARGYYSTAIGNNAYAKAYGSFVIGQYNEIAGDSAKWQSTDPLFVIGNGLNSSNRNNALTIYKSGRSIFEGENSNITLNDKRTMIYPFSSTSVYGIRAYINRNDPDVDYYYSAYLYDVGTEGSYQGFYTDVRSGSSADVAEYIYDTNGNTEPGDVLVADPGKKKSVITSSQPYQSSVLGVVSTDPHLVMGMELVIDEETGAPKTGVQATRLALTGRVPCKVTDENGPIKPGDLITTSSTPGHAMKWTAVDVNKAKDFDELKRMLSENELRRNAVIGKALESHDNGKGEIMVLISLQ